MSATLLEAVRLFDGETVRTPGRLLIQDGQIAAVGEGAPEGVERIEFGNATILPGLIDAHVHLCFDGGVDIIERLEATDDDALVEQMARDAAFALRAGVTTVRDLGARGDSIFRLRDGIQAGRFEGPHILAAGRALTIPMGHCYFLGGAAADEAELLTLVRTEIERGADVIKIMSTGGAMTPSSDPTRPQFAPDTLRRAVDLAHSLGRPVAAHAHSREGMHDAIAAGVDTIEHGTFVGDDGAHIHNEDLSLFPNSRTVLTPTLFPIATRANNHEVDGGPLAREATGAEFWERRRRDVKRLFESGTRMIAGSDCGVSHLPHDSVIDEIACLAQVGMSAAQALGAATSVCADVLGVGAVTGRLRPGLRADVLVVEGDPLHDLAALRRPMAVYKSGQPVR